MAKDPFVVLRRGTLPTKTRFGWRYQSTHSVRDLNFPSREAPSVSNRSLSFPLRLARHEFSSRGSLPARRTVFSLLRQPVPRWALTGPELTAGSIGKAYRF